MDLEKYWQKALQQTEVIRSRIQPLLTMGDTRVSYVLLSESTINVGDTVVRKGEVLMHRPSIIIPPNHPQFSGFDFEDKMSVNEESLISFLLVRGISLPSMQYNNTTSSLDIYEGKLSDAVKNYEDILIRKEDVHTGLVVGPEDCWQFSLLIFVCMQAARNAESDIRKLLEEYHRKNRLN